MKKLSVLAAVLLLSACVQNNQTQTLQNRVAQQDQQIQQLNAQLSGVQPAQADTWAQVQTMRQEMATMKGQIDNFNNATASVGGLNALADKIARQDAALRLIETQFGLKLNLGEPITAIPATGLATGMTTGINGSGYANTNPYNNAPQAVAPQAAQQVQPVQQPAPAASTDVAQVLYDSGYRYFTGRQYNEALNAFTDFTKTYSKHTLAGNAWFWKAESNYQLKNYSNAALDYDVVINKYPKNSKVPSAYLKQAMCFIEAKKKDVARYRLDDLIKKFPKSAEATRAKQLLKEIK